VAAFLDLPLIRGDEISHAGIVAAFADPWPGSVAFCRSPTDSGFEVKALATQPATMGSTETMLNPGPSGRWDRANVLRVKLGGGMLASADPLLVLGSSNLAAIEAGEGVWEIFQFATATLVAPLTYDLSDLLRGQYGTEGAMVSAIPAGARVVLLNAALVQVDMTASDVGLAYNWKYGSSRYDIGHPSFVTRSAFAFQGIGLRPLSPCHVSGSFEASGDLTVNWIRRTRQDGDGWEQVEVPLGEDIEAYEIDVMDGANVARTLSSNAPSVTYAVDQQIADFGALQESYTLRVYQLSASYGRGQGREAIVP
jgi:hypothetical protein